LTATPLFTQDVRGSTVFFGVGSRKAEFPAGEHRNESRCSKSEASQWRLTAGLGYEALLLEHKGSALCQERRGRKAFEPR